MTLASNPTRVLVVDDHTDVAEMLAAVLALHGLEVRTAFEDAAALHIAATWLPHAVLLDISMPGLGGYELCRRMRQQAQGTPPLMLACTGWDEDEERSNAAGFDAHLLKPVNPAAVLRLLQQAR